LAAAGSPALAQSPGAPSDGPGRGPVMWRGGERTDGELWLMIRAAGLSPEQQAKVRTILGSHRTAMRPVITQLRQSQQELGAKLLAPGPVQVSDLQPQLTRISQLRDQLAQDSAQAALEVRAVLLPDQLAKVSQTKERLRQLREEMRQLMQSGAP
ncbi:MAG TPA: periplasmic heavy metal sensor, partial [Methylomirabilota bacterium]|nr:periplasmic heavy metal sensor [Methylomirabilota bacterium]